MIHIKCVFEGSEIVGKLYQFISALQCLHESNNICKGKNKYKGFRRIEKRLEDLIGDIIWRCILAYGIFKGWIVIPTVLGDGYDYDNFDRNICNSCLRESFVEL